MDHRVLAERAVEPAPQAAHPAAESALSAGVRGRAARVVEQVAVSGRRSRESRSPTHRRGIVASGIPQACSAGAKRIRT